MCLVMGAKKQRNGQPRGIGSRLTEEVQFSFVLLNTGSFLIDWGGLTGSKEEAQWSIACSGSKRYILRSLKVVRG